MALGKNIEHLRKLSGYTRRSVARGIGLEDDQALYALESRDSARSEFAPALARFFSVDLEALITRDLTKYSKEELLNHSFGLDHKSFDPTNARALENLELVPAHVNQRPVRAPMQSDISAFAEQAAELLRLFAKASPSGRNLVLDAARSAAENNINNVDFRATNQS